MVILGDMRELGAESHTEYKRIVKQLQEMKLERSWLVGDEFEKVASAGMRVFNDVDAVKVALKEEPITNSTILIKGSNSTKLYQLPEAI